MAVIGMSIRSRYLNGKTSISVILPDISDEVDPQRFYSGNRKYKVLFLLHGTEGDHSDFIRQTAIERYAQERNMAVVMPSCLNSDYMDWPSFGIGLGVRKYITEELVPLVHSWLPVSSRREDNYIAGISMGGRGALSIAMEYPELFSAVASLSGPPLCLPRLEESQAYRAFPERYRNLIALSGGYDAFLASSFDAWGQIDRLAEKGALPRMMLAIGKDDPYLDDYMLFKGHAGEKGYQIVFVETPGYGHEWSYWDLQLPLVLDFLIGKEGNMG